MVGTERNGRRAVRRAHLASRIETVDNACGSPDDDDRRVAGLRATDQSHLADHRRDLAADLVVGDAVLVRIRAKGAVGELVEVVEPAHWAVAAGVVVAWPRGHGARELARGASRLTEVDAAAPVERVVGGAASSVPVLAG